jgi:hypothetical protein
VTTKCVSGLASQTLNVRNACGYIGAHKATAQGGKTGSEDFLWKEQAKALEHTARQSKEAKMTLY